MSELSTILSIGTCLIDSPTPSSDLKATLLNRLDKYYARLGSTNPAENASLELIQFTTAREALSVVSKVQNIIGVDTKPESGQPPLIGTRDLSQLRTLLSIVFQWGVNPLFAQIFPALLAPTTANIDLPKDYSSLSSLIADLFSLLFPDGVQGRIPQTLITTTILERHPADLLKPSMVLGWLPKSLRSKSHSALDAVRPMTMRFLTLLPPYETINILGGILSSHPTPPLYVRKLCVNLLGRQLLRPQGIQSLCAAVFGEEEAAMDSVVEKLQHVTRVFTTVPFNTDPEEHFRRLTPKLIDLLSPRESAVNKRTAAYVISRMLAADGSFPHQEIASKITLYTLHDSFIRAFKSASYPELLTPRDPAPPSPFLTLNALLTLVSNADPSPTLISSLLSPIVLILYSLLNYMDKVKATDPSLRESLRGLLITWAKLVGISDGVNILWSVLHSDYRQWNVDSEGKFTVVQVIDQQKPLSFLTPQDLHTDDESLPLEANILNLYPDPAHFVEFLKTMERTDISSDLFVNLLEAYRNHKSAAREDPTRTLLYLQIITLMQTRLTDGKSSTNILCKPTHMLSFVKHVLEPAEQVPKEESRSDRHSLLFMKEDDNLSVEGDSDDEDAFGTNVASADGEMIETAITLLLSILEANEDLSAINAPVLNDIFSLLDPFAHEGSDTLRPLAREARMVMTARLASTSSQRARPSNQTKESAYDVYQKALKLLQDPILPVRAHGLLLLRQLVSPMKKDSSEPQLNDNALVPAILSIFLQSVQDDDSYVFLNAVQGLAAMVDRFGKDVLSQLMTEYTGGLDGLGASNLTQHDLDVRLRIGEALAVVIRRYDAALGIYVDNVVPRLLKIARSSLLPTALRTSSLSLLAGCQGASPLSMLLYAKDLAEAMIDILQIETIPAKSRPFIALEGEVTQLSDLNAQPLSTNSKLPPLRRAALHFLSLLFQGITKQIYDGSYGGDLFLDPFLGRAKTILSYVATTDEDDIVKTMAKEANEHLNQMNMAMVGL